jgi:hypothetical protein
MPVSIRQTKNREIRFAATLQKREKAEGEIFLYKAFKSQRE